MLKKLFISDIKMLIRNRQALFWSLAFPLMFTIIFGFFFGKGASLTGKVILINQANTEIADNLERALTDSEVMKIVKSDDLADSRDSLKKGEITAVIIIPADFGRTKPTGQREITVVLDPANMQSNSVITGFVNNFLTELNYQTQGVKKVYHLKEERTNSRELTYFDFVMVGLIGLALMNVSIQGVSITMARYREDKILKRIVTTPIKPWKFIVAEVLSRLILNIIQVSLILSVSVFFFGANIYGSILLIFLFSLIGAALFQSIGFMIASFCQTTDAAQGMAMSINIPMMFLAGVFFPIDQLPAWLTSIVQYIPLAPLLRMIRQIALEDISPFTELSNILIVVGWLIIMLIISAFKFRMSDE